MFKIDQNMSNQVKIDQNRSYRSKQVKIGQNRSNRSNRSKQVKIGHIGQNRSKQVVMGKIGQNRSNQVKNIKKVSQTSFNCKQCLLSFTNANNLAVHTRIKHITDGTDPQWSISLRVPRYGLPILADSVWDAFTTVNLLNNSKISM